MDSKHGPTAVLLCTALLLLAFGVQAGKDPRRCGNREGAICCGSWGNTCINNTLTCCNDTCIAAPFNPTNPEAVCKVKLPDVCTFDDMLVKTNKFNSANAYVMTALAKAVYPDAWALPDNDTLVGSAFTTWVTGYGITNATFLNARNKRHEVDTEGVCMRDDKGNVFVVFRGTSSMADVSTDADFFGSVIPKRNIMFGGKGVNLHDGFTDAYYYVRDATKACARQYMTEVSEKLHSGNKSAAGAKRPMLWVGGHSLGAALATLAALDFAQMGYKPVVYTIGSPRVGDKDWVKLYDDDNGLKNVTFRMVNERDPVARVPTQAQTYRHVGTMVYLNATSGDCIVPANETDCEPTCVVSDHYTDPYMNATYQCVLNDKSIDLAKCPVSKRLPIPTNYDLVAAEPGRGTLVNESAAVLNGTLTADGKPPATSAATAAAAPGVLVAAAVTLAAVMLVVCGQGL